MKQKICPLLSAVLLIFTAPLSPNSLRGKPLAAAGTTPMLGRP
jgi:hypothetical protein